MPGDYPRSVYQQKCVSREAADHQGRAAAPSMGIPPRFDKDRQPGQDPARMGQFPGTLLLPAIERPTTTRQIIATIKGRAGRTG